MAVTLGDPIWHVSSRSSETCLQTAVSSHSTTPTPTPTSSPTSSRGFSRGRRRVGRGSSRGSRCRRRGMRAIPGYFALYLFTVPTVRVVRVATYWRRTPRGRRSSRRWRRRRVVRCQARPSARPPRRRSRTEVLRPRHTHTHTHTRRHHHEITHLV